MDREFLFAIAFGDEQRPKGELFSVDVMYCFRLPFRSNLAPYLSAKLC